MTTRKNTRQALRRSIEVLERRCLLAANVFLDFGFNFPAGGLSVNDTQMGTAPINGPSVFGAGHTLISLTQTVLNENVDFNGDGTTNAADATDLANGVLSAVRRTFEPFDVNVLFAGASSIADVSAALTGGSNDAYIFVAGDDPAANPAFGWAQVNPGNTNDNTGFAFADEIIRSGFTNAEALARTAAHEAGHTFGLRHTDASLAIAVGDEMGAPAGGTDLRDSSIVNVFSRFPMPRNPGNAAPFNTGTQNAFSILAANVGVQPASPAYITGTGASDRINITGVTATTANITVTSYTDATYSSQIGAPFTLLGVSTTHGILVEAGAGDDEISIAGNAGISAFPLTIRGGGDNDTVVAPTRANNWTISGQNAGSLNFAGLDYIEVENLRGGGGADTFTFSVGGILDGTVDGGGGTSDTVQAADNVNVWAITGANSGTLDTAGDFINVERINGGTFADEFVFNAGGIVGGSINGGGGNDLLNFATLAGQTVTLTNPGGIDGFNGFTPGVTPIGGFFFNINSVAGSAASGADSLTGLDVDSFWDISGAKGTYTDFNAVLEFEGFETFNGGASIDKFFVAPSTASPLTINGGPPATFPGDTLQVDLTGTTSPQLLVLIPNSQGRFTFASHETVDYAGIEQLKNYDFGDAPVKYGTLLADNGAQHRLGGDLRLGHVDPEMDGQPNPTASGDDNVGTPDDEDGVSIPPILLAHFKAAFTVNVAGVIPAGGAKLDAWIDFNGNGVFEANERIAEGLAVVAGANALKLKIPDAAVTGATYARFRLSSAGGLGPTGLAEDGEVEDYQVQIVSPPHGGFLKVPDPVYPGGTFLVAGGTSGNETILFERYHPDHTIRLIRNGIVLAAFPEGEITRVGAIGRSGNDTIILDDEFYKWAEFYGDYGKDSLFGARGQDCLDGGAADDNLFGLGGNDSLVGDVGNDFLYGGDGNDQLSGGDGADHLFGGNNDDLLRGGAGNDFLYGELGADVMLGEAGSDHLFGGDGRDVMIGGGGGDYIYGEGHDDLVIAGSTTFDANNGQLNLIRAEWRSARTYSQRVDNLRNGTGPILAGTVVKISGSANVVGDGAVDELFGNGDLDWFLSNSGDKLFDKNGNELVN